MYNCGVTIGLMLTITGIGCQQLKQSPLERISPCSDGLRAGIDKYIVHTTFGPNLTPLHELGWDSFAQFEMSSSTNIFHDVCAAFVSPESCRPYNSSDTRKCFCRNFRDPITGLTHLVVNETAQVSGSQRIIRWKWGHVNATYVTSDKNITLPIIYDVKDAVLELKVNGIPAQERNGSCGVNFTVGTENTMTLCCNQTASPCYPMMAIDGVVVPKQPGCVAVTVTAQQGSLTSNLTKSYSVCTETDIQAAGSCNLGAAISVITPTTVTTKDQTTSVMDMESPGTKDGMGMDYTTGKPDSNDGMGMDYTTGKPDSNVSESSSSSLEASSMVGIIVGVGLFAIGSFIALMIVRKKMSSTVSDIPIRNGDQKPVQNSEQEPAQDSKQGPDQDSEVHEKPQNGWTQEPANGGPTESETAENHD